MSKAARNAYFECVHIVDSVLCSLNKDYLTLTFRVLTIKDGDFFQK